LIGLGPVVPGALAADMPVKAPPVVIEDTPWWTHGFIEFGGRGFLNDPPYGGHIWQGQGSLAKYYEYSSIKPGPFGDFFAAAGSKNGLYEIDAWGTNVGYSDQRYNAYWSKAGEQYLNFQYDQTPHIYSTSASTLFTGIGTNHLTLANPNLGNQLFNAGVVGWPATANSPATIATLNTKAAGVATVINQNLLPTSIGIHRDTASVDYRITPTDNWDIRANYSDLKRTGTQVDSVLFTATNAGSRVDVPKPVDDQTQNFGVNGEYIGSSPWGGKFNAMVGYNGSYYHDNFSSYTVQNPFCGGPAGLCANNASQPPAGGTATAPLAQMSTPPSNNMNGVTGTFGVDLPLHSRYMGTVSYSGMRQNDQFLPFSINPALLSTGQQAASLASLPAQSLNGQINTLLVNNVVTTQINPDLKTKFSYRYYGYDNQTPQITISDWIITDATSAKNTTNNYAPVNPLMVGYIRQNGAAEATWRPVNTVNIGSAYNYEHYDFTRFDASSTAENTGKVYAEKWLTFRASGSYGERRAGNYDYLGNVGMFQWPVPRPAATSTTAGVTTTTFAGFPNSTNYAPAYRQFYLDDRNRAQAKFQVDIDVLRNLTITPNVTWRDDEFLLQQNQLGLTHDRSTAAGVEAAYAATPDLKLLFSYMNEQRGQFMFGSGTNIFPATTNTLNGGMGYICPNTNGNAIGGTATYLCQLYSANINDRVNTFIFGLNYAFIPRRLEVGVNYTGAYGRNSSPLFMQNGTGPVVSNIFGSNIPSPQFPDVTTSFQRIELNGKYVLDPDLVRTAGLKGEVSLRLRYAWERNSVTNWNNDLMMPYMYQVLGQSQVAYYQSMAWNNPNYNVHMIGGTVAWAW
jgi:MtrB/PioB family decaheme-associated outer membrane protein